MIKAVEVMLAAGVWIIMGGVAFISFALGVVVGVIL